MFPPPASSCKLEPFCEAAKSFVAPNFRTLGAAAIRTGYEAHWWKLSGVLDGVLGKQEWDKRSISTKSFGAFPMSKESGPDHLLDLERDNSRLPDGFTIIRRSKRPR